MSLEAKSEELANIQEGRSGLKAQKTGVKVIYDSKSTKAVQELSVNIIYAGLRKNRSVKGAAIEGYPLTKR